MAQTTSYFVNLKSFFKFRQPAEAEENVKDLQSQL